VNGYESAFTRHLSVALVAAVMATLRPATGRADPAVDLLAEARAEEARHHDDVAIARYHEAVSLDPTLEDAYLGLAALRVRLGDLREADRVHSLALARIPGFARARRARADVRRKLGLRVEATADLAAYAEATDDADAFSQLVTWYSEDGFFPKALAIARRLRERARQRNDDKVTRDARALVRALESVVGEADPVVAPPRSASGRPSSFRAIAARVAKQSL